MSVSDILFSGALPEAKQLPVQQIIGAVAQLNSGRPAYGRELAEKTFTMEGMRESDTAALKSGVDSLLVRLKRELPTASTASLKAAAYAHAHSEAPTAAVKNQGRTLAQVRSVFAADENTLVVSAEGMSDTLDARSSEWQLEAFQETENTRVQQYSVAYNLLASRQDLFGETLYPTVVVAPEHYGYMVSINLAIVQDDVRRQTTGALALFNRKNVAWAYTDANILQDESTRCVPVYRDDTVDNSDKFLDAIGVQTVKVGNEMVNTKPLLCGVEHDLLGLSQTNAMLALGESGVEDDLDSSIRLSKIYVKLHSGNTTEYFSFPTDKLPFNDFSGATQANSRKMTLNFETSALKFVAGQKTVAGTTSALLSALTDRVVHMKVDIFGKVTLDTATTVVNPAKLTVASITATDKSQVADPNIVAALASAEVVGYDLLAWRTNAARRQRGKLLDSQTVNMLYTVPLLSPLSTLRPVGKNDAEDAAKVSVLINATHVKTSNAAVTSVLDLRETLATYASSVDTFGNSPVVLGAASYVLKPFYDNIGAFNVATNVDSLTSSARIADLQTLLINKIRDSAARMAYNSGYLNALRLQYNGVPPKIVVIIATDPIIERYLTINGDPRLAGDQFDYKIVSSLDSRMFGRVLITLGLEEAMTSGAPNWLHFGNMAWKPELTVVMPMVRNNANVVELTVQPCFRHINNLPLMVEMTVTGIESIIGGKVSMNVNNTVITP